jgi:lysophospholipase L1-like esterase
LRLLFIHHSVGGQMLADPGPAQALADSIYTTHPNGGGLRARLQGATYQVFEASYGSSIGDKTDLFDWLPKFRDRMDDVLTTSGNDAHHASGARNDVVVFKSCYPNNRFLGEGAAPGDPAGPELTVWNAKATLRALLPELARHPDTLFVYMTAPPVAPRGHVEPAWKWLAKKVLGKPSYAAAVRRQGELARAFNDWVASPDGWLAGYPHENVVVFDLYDVLTGGASNLSRFPTGDGDDSHPSSAGNQQAAERFVGFLNRAVHRAGVD